MRERIVLSREEQLFLMEMLETDDPMEAVEKFATIMTEEKADPTQLQKYIKKIMDKVL